SLQLRKGEALPTAEGQLGKAGVGAIAGRVEAEPGPHELHGLSGAPEWTRDEVEPFWIAAVAIEQVAHDLAATRGLAAPDGIERDVVLTLQPAFRIPVGLAVAHEVENRRRH